MTDAAPQPASPLVTTLIPAYQEGTRVGATVRAIAAALEEAGRPFQILVIDDGSTDGTAEAALASGAELVRLGRNFGKGRAIEQGLKAARGEVVLMLDADLEDSAAQAVALLAPVLDGTADVVTAAFPAPIRAGGLGLVVRLARWGVRRFGGPYLRSPLSGQRALRRDTLQRLQPLDPGFGLEMGMNLDAVRLGLRIRELPLQMRHRETGRDPAGFLHRGRQWWGVARAILLRKVRPRGEPRRRA